MKKLIARTIGLWINFLARVAPGRAAKFGFEFFCRPFRVKMTDKHRAFLHSGEQSTFTHAGETIQAYKWGRGDRRILLLHGWQSHTFRWKSYVEAFDKERYTIYAIDAPGHGLSSGKFLTVPLYSEVVEKFMQATGSFDTVLSHSIGSFTALYTFYRLPRLAPDQLIVLAPPGEALDFFSFYIGELRLSPKSVKLIVGYFETRIGRSPSYFSAPKFAQGLSSQGLLIHDEEDGDAPVENSRRIHGAWNNSTLIITKGFGHNLRSEKVVDYVLDFANHDIIAR
ncbi:alpha/beta fold hydrolase [Dawidia soli]|uniref:Alpha/beta hydrolase n=1 Tax=Dawidia soli TaxID=2782352 RepID=A0AAP2DB15_9BACT|nr:alpha/beta hydrolase [Dawidia soli]MBT1688678.1 alpha/beta hydrolase [Dawidia soli]